MEKTLKNQHQVGDTVRVGRGTFEVLSVNPDNTLMLKNLKTGEQVMRKANLRKL